LKQVYSHTFKFETNDYKENDKINNNIISVIEEDSKKHYVNYIQYHTAEDNKILSKELNIKVDRSYYLEISNIAIDDFERKKKLFTIIGKRCFGSNNNKLDCYFLETNLDSNEIYKCFEKHRDGTHTHPILHELITHSTNKYEAYPFFCKNRYFAILKQINISSRKTFEKSFLVQMKKPDYTKLLAYQTNELKIDYIFNLIGDVHFKRQPLEQKVYDELNYSADSIIDKKLEEISDGTITNNTFLNKELFGNLKKNNKNIENAYFSFLSRGLKFINEPDNEEIIYLFHDSISKAIDLIKDEELLEEIVSFLELLKIIIKEKKISYLMSKKDQDIKDIFIYMLESVTVFNATINEDKLGDFNRATIDLYNILKYLIDTYFKFYYDYKTLDAKNSKVKEDIDTQNDYFVSAKEFFKDVEVDYLILDELSELQTELDISLCSQVFNDGIKENSSRFLNCFIRLLNGYHQFQNMAYVLSLLNEQIVRFESFKNSEDALEFYKAIIDDLVSYKKEVFELQSAENIFYIDDSLYLNVAQIDVYFENIKSQEELDFFK
jgi:hypothetical protein